MIFQELARLSPSPKAEKMYEENYLPKWEALDQNSNIYSDACYHNGGIAIPTGDLSTTVIYHEIVGNIVLNKSLPVRRNIHA